MAGTTRANAPRAGRGTLRCGRKEASAPGRLVPVSGITATRTSAAAKAPSSSHHTSWVGAGPYWTSTAVSSTPRARPALGALLDSSGARPPRGRRSSSTAPSVLDIAPTAIPSRARAANSSPGPCASRNSAHAATSTAMAARISGRRPMWSDSEPKISSVASTNST